MPPTVDDQTVSSITPLSPEFNLLLAQTPLMKHLSLESCHGGIPE
jgi:hypothetical protein